jgi:hypothetical protein
MRAAALERFGGVENIHLKQLPVPEPGPDEVLLHVESASVGVWDPYEREGEFAKMFGRKPTFPYVLGSDGAGTMAAVGAQVHRFKEGDHAYALALLNPKGGFYAEYAAVKADNVSAIPKIRTVWSRSQKRRPAARSKATISSQVPSSSRSSTVRLSPVRSKSTSHAPSRWTKPLTPTANSTNITWANWPCVRSNSSETSKLEIAIWDLRFLSRGRHTLPIVFTEHGVRG